MLIYDIVDALVCVFSCSNASLFTAHQNRSWLHVYFVLTAVDPWLEFVFSGSGSWHGSVVVFTHWFSHLSAEIIRAAEEQEAWRSARGQSAHQEHGQGGVSVSKWNVLIVLFVFLNQPEFCLMLIEYYQQVQFSLFLFIFLQDEVRTQKAKKQKSTLEAVNNSVKLLNEMLAHFSPEDSTDGDKELIRVRTARDNSTSFMSLA